MSSSEPPAVGPDRAALYEIARKAMDASVVAVLNGDELIDPAKVTVDSVLAALAASGAGPTEPSDDLVAHVSGAIADELARMALDRNESGVAALPLDWAVRLGRAALRAGQREQEPASDRYFTPQPVDAPPREKP